MRKGAYPKRKVELPKRKVELVFETSKLDTKGKPLIAIAREVPDVNAEEIASYFNIMGDGEIMVDEATYNKEIRQSKAKDPETKDNLGWINHKLSPNLGKSGIWGCRLISQYSLEESKSNSQRALFYDNELDPDPPQANVSEIATARQTAEQDRAPEVGSSIEINETWNTPNGKFRPGAKAILVATEKETGEFIASREMPEDFSGQVRDSLEREAEAILARQKAA